jgi:hypothetical protein
VTVKLTTSILWLWLTACATAYQPTYFFDEILLVNKSRQLVQDVTITASESGRRFSCGNIAPLGICSNKFRPRRYQQRPIQIAWIFGNNARETREFVLEVPSSFETGLALRGVLEITPAGSISAYFEQEGTVD